MTSVPFVYLYNLFKHQDYTVVGLIILKQFQMLFMKDKLQIIGVKTNLEEIELCLRFDEISSTKDPSTPKLHTEHYSNHCSFCPCKIF